MVVNGHEDHIGEKAEKRYFRYDGSGIPDFSDRIKTHVEEMLFYKKKRREMLFHLTKGNDAS